MKPPITSDEEGPGYMIMVVLSEDHWQFAISHPSHSKICEHTNLPAERIPPLFVAELNTMLTKEPSFANLALSNVGTIGDSSSLSTRKMFSLLKKTA
jgi:hypothetical protein